MAELKAVYLLGIALERKLHGMMVFGHSKLIVEWFREHCKRVRGTSCYHCTGKGVLLSQFHKEFNLRWMCFGMTW